MLSTLNALSYHFIFESIHHLGKCRCIFEDVLLFVYSHSIGICSNWIYAVHIIWYCMLCLLNSCLCLYSLTVLVSQNILSYHTIIHGISCIQLSFICLKVLFWYLLEMWFTLELIVWLNFVNAVSSWL